MFPALSSRTESKEERAGGGGGGVAAQEMTPPAAAALETSVGPLAAIYRIFFKKRANKVKLWGGRDLAHILQVASKQYFFDALLFMSSKSG